MSVRIFCSFILVLLHFQLANADVITLDGFLGLVKESHPFFTKENLSSKIQKKEQERFLGSQDWIINSTPFYAYQKVVVTSPFSPEKMHMAGAEVGVQKTFWQTGGRFSLSWSTDFSDQEIPDIVIPITPSPVVFPAGPSEFYQNKTYLTYSQPLLQNFGGKLDRLEYELGHYAIDMTEIQALENQEGFVLDLSTRFLDWALLGEQKKIADDRLLLAELELQRTKKKRAANLVRKVDVLRAEDAVRIGKQNIVMIESQWKAKQAELAVLAQSQVLHEQSPEFDLYGTETLPAADEAVLKLKGQSRILRTLAAQQERLSHLRDGYGEMGRPQLYLTAGAGLQSGDTLFSGSLDLDKPDILVSLDFQYPLGSRTAQADFKKTNMQLRQLKEEIANVELDLEAGLRSLLIQISEIENVLTLNQEQIKSAQKKTQEEVRLYNQGRGDLTFVIQSRDNEENAKLMYAQNAALYHKLILQYRALMDELLPSKYGEQK